MGMEKFFFVCFVLIFICILFLSKLYSIYEGGDGDGDGDGDLGRDFGFCVFFGEPPPDRVLDLFQTYFFPSIFLILHLSLQHPLFNLVHYPSQP